MVLAAEGVMVTVGTGVSVGVRVLVGAVVKVAAGVFEGTGVGLAACPAPQAEKHKAASKVKTKGIKGVCFMRFHSLQ
jgi:hypothetical protein